MENKLIGGIDLPIMPHFLNNCNEKICIITEKIYSQCKDRICFTNITKKIPTGYELEKINFQNASIEKNTLKIERLKNRPDFCRVKFIAKVIYEIIFSNGEKLKGELPYIKKDIVLYYPKTRDEFQFKIKISSVSTNIEQPKIYDNELVISIGVFLIISLVGRVQLLIPSFGFCPEPLECDEYIGNKICADFDYLPFPRFYPPQFNDIFPEC